MKRDAFPQRPYAATSLRAFVPPPAPETSPAAPPASAERFARSAPQPAPPSFFPIEAAAHTSASPSLPPETFSLPPTQDATHPPPPGSPAPRPASPSVQSPPELAAN